MFLDSTLLYGLAKEMHETLRATVVRQIHQLDARVIDIELYRPALPPVHLILSAQNPPCCYTLMQAKKQKESQYIASQNFIMTLRKNLEGARLSGIEQIRLDRILRFAFDRIETGGEIVTKYLYAELIPSAPNIILTEGDAITDVLVRGKKQHRTLDIHHEYELPEGAGRLDFMSFSAEELANLLTYGKSDDADLKSWLFSHFNGLSTPLMTALSERAKVPADTAMSALTDTDIRAVAGELLSLAEKIRAASGLYLAKRGGKEYVSILPTPGAEHRPSVAEWIAQKTEENGGVVSATAQELKKYIHGLIRKEERKISKIEAEMAETLQLEQYKHWGELLAIYAYINVSGKTEIIIDDPYSETGEKAAIPLLPEYNLIRNSQIYFKKYGRMKTRREIGAKKLAECRMRLEYFRNMAYFAEEAKDRTALSELRDELKQLTRREMPSRLAQKNRKAKKTAASDIPAQYTIGGYTVWIGKNSRQNEHLTLHMADKNDLWLHAQKIPGSHVVIETDGAPVPDDILKKAAAFAAWYSRARDSGKVAVDMTLIRHVKKIPGGPPGLVNYTHQKTIMAVPNDPDAKK